MPENGAMRTTFIIGLLLTLLTHGLEADGKPPVRKGAQAPRAPSSTPGLPDEFVDEEEEDEDMEEPDMGRPPPMPSPFNTVNPNAIGGANRPDPGFSPSRPVVGSPMTAGPAKFKFKIVEGEFYEKGKKRGRARNGTPAYQGSGSSSPPSGATPDTLPD